MNNMPTDIRWKQRFDNFHRAYLNFQEAVMLANVRTLSKLEEQGLIQSFEYTHELAWKVLKDYLEEQGFTDVVGSKNATRIAFKEGLIQHGEIWMQMIEARNQTSHSYNIEIATAISAGIRNVYYSEFVEFVAVFQKLQDKKR